jgi:hypothetical protein
MSSYEIHQVADPLQRGYFRGRKTHREGLFRSQYDANVRKTIPPRDVFRSRCHGKFEIVQFEQVTYQLAQAIQNVVVIHIKYLTPDSMHDSADVICDRDTA